MNYKLAPTRRSGAAKRTFWTTWLRIALTGGVEGYCLFLLQERLISCCVKRPLFFYPGASRNVSWGSYFGLPGFAEHTTYYAYMYMYNIHDMACDY